LRMVKTKTAAIHAVKLSVSMPGMIVTAKNTAAPVMRILIMALRSPPWNGDSWSTRVNRIVAMPRHYWVVAGAFLMAE